MLGYLDDLVLIPLGVLLVRKLIPPLVLQDCRARAAEVMAAGKPVNWTAAVIIVLLWLLTLAAILLLAARVLGG